MRDKNIEMLQDTLQILNDGSYTVNGKKVSLKLTNEQMQTTHVLLPENVKDIGQRTDFDQVFVLGRCGYGCVNMDSFSVAIRQYQHYGYTFNKDSKPVLVLNFANPVNPGGGVRRGARAQEEDLCRKSSLLLSLESEHAEQYYQYNRGLHTYMGSDAMIFTPQVEIIRDEQGNLLDETFVVAVLTCAAPMIQRGTEGMTQNEYKKLLYNRITGMLKCAAYFGYDHLVLGAWGCGAFGNDAAVMSDLFYQALKELRFNGMSHKDLFRRIDFAVLDKSPTQYNYQEFYRNFSFESFYREENQKANDAALQRIKESEMYLDKTRGSLIGGAVGDALGYAIEFWHESEIFAYYGSEGIQDYELDRRTGKALISDDTQMTLFTANGILVGDTQLSMRGIGGKPSIYVPMSYQDWLRTQEMSFEESRKARENGTRCESWLSDVPELYDLRAPGNTCLSALTQQKNGRHFEGSYIDHPLNQSKGCGGIMRVAPMGLKHYPHTDIKSIDREGAELAAITHGHSLGYMPAAVLTHIISRIVYPQKQLSLKEIVLEARDTVAELFADDQNMVSLTNVINTAVALSENTEKDLHNIYQLGEGWVAEETLGIAIYCALRHQNDFSAGVIAAVNHNGDSDSTGAVTGNILGAWLGFDAIEEKWKKNLELYEVILEMADDLCHGCQMGDYSSYSDPDWERKYIYMQWKEQPPKEKCETKIMLVKGDITKDHDVQAIVNAANCSLLGGGGVDGAIHRAAGPELLAECRTLYGCETGQAKITKAYRLPCEYVIHTPGPIWKGGSHNERNLLASCYRSCLKLAVENHIRSLAFPSISTGVYAFPVEEAARIAIDTVKQFVKEYPSAFDVIKWVLYDNNTLTVYDKALSLSDAADIVHSPVFDAINRMLRNGGQ